MRYWPGILCFIFSFSAFASRTIQTRIHEIDQGTRNEPTLILLESGDVAKLSPNSKFKRDFTPSLHQAYDQHSLINVTLDDERFIVGIQSSETPIEEMDSAYNLKSNEPYVPTVLNSFEEIEGIFSKLNGGYRRKSQCYNRAQVWTHESFIDFNLKSMKVFLFFTSKYIREFNYKWWFHVSPFSYVMENGLPAEKVMDYSYVEKPVPMKEWTDMFISNRAECPVIQKYTDYSLNQNAQYCYLFKANMYYYQPLDLEKLEQTGIEKTDWVSWEVNNAYRQDF